MALAPLRPRKRGRKRTPSPNTLLGALEGREIAEVKGSAEELHDKEPFVARWLAPLG